MTEGSLQPVPEPASQTWINGADGAPVSVRLYRRDGWSIVEIIGELDIAGVPLLRRLLPRAGRPLMVDVRGVTFIDCVGLRAITFATNADAARGVLVVGESGPVRRLLDLTGWARDVSLHASVDVAVRDPLRARFP